MIPKIIELGRRIHESGARPPVEKDGKYILIKGFDAESSIISIYGEAICEGMYKVELPYDHVKELYHQMVPEERWESEDILKKGYFDKVYGKPMDVPLFISSRGQRIWGYRVKWLSKEDYEFMKEIMEEAEDTLPTFEVLPEEAMEPKILEQIW